MTPADTQLGDIILCTPGQAHPPTRHITLCELNKCKWEREPFLTQFASLQASASCSKGLLRLPCGASRRYATWKAYNRLLSRATTLPLSLSTPGCGTPVFSSGLNNYTRVHNSTPATTSNLSSLELKWTRTQHSHQAWEFILQRQ